MNRPSNPKELLARVLSLKAALEQIERLYAELKEEIVPIGHENFNKLMAAALLFMEQTISTDSIALMELLLRRGVQDLVREVRELSHAAHDRSTVEDRVRAYADAYLEALKEARQNHGFVELIVDVTEVFAADVLPAFCNPSRRDWVIDCLDRLAKLRLPKDRSAAAIWVGYHRTKLLATVPLAPGIRREDDGPPSSRSR